MLSMQATQVHLAGSAMHQQRFGVSNVGSTQTAILGQHTRRSDSPCSDISAQQNRSHTAAAICSMAASPYSSAANCSSATKNHTHVENILEICNTQASNNSLVNCTARAFKLTRMLSVTATHCHAGAPLQLVLLPFGTHETGCCNKGTHTLHRQTTHPTLMVARRADNVSPQLLGAGWRAAPLQEMHNTPHHHLHTLHNAVMDRIQQPLQQAVVHKCFSNSV
jgi:hypothetical protein